MFLAPYMLLGALAAGIPIAIHFFFRSRYRTVPWAAMKFLLESIEQTSRRLRFQELLLLILRCAVLVFLALAFARPLTTLARGAGRGDAVDAVFLFDTSYSMGARDGAVTRLERAQEAALKILEGLPPHSSVQIVACSDRAELAGPQSPGNLDQGASLIKNLRLSHLATDLYPGAVEAAAILQRAQASNKELYLFSDMQTTGWDRQAGGLVAALQEVHDKAVVTLVRCGTRPVANIAVVGIAPQSGVPRPGERVGFAVLVRNTGAEPVKEVNVALRVGNDAKLVETQAIPLIAPGELRAVPLTAKLAKAGLHTLTATVQHDDLEGDNRFDQIVQVRDQVNVLVVDGGQSDRDPRRSSSYYLMNALAPVKDAERGKHYLQPRLIPPRLAAPALLAKQDLCILVNAAVQTDAKQPAALPADFLDELGRFVRQGKGLLIFAGDQVQPNAYNRVLSQKLGLLPMPIKSVVERPIKEPLLVNRDSFDLPALLKFKTDELYKDFNRVEVWKALELDATRLAPVRRTGTDAAPADKDNDDAEDAAAEAPPVVALRYQNATPAIVSRKVDAGEVVLVTTAADPGWKDDVPHPVWTDWPLHFVYVPFIDVLVAHLLHGQTQNHNLVAGETLRWHPRDRLQRTYTLVHPDGERMRLGLPEKHGNREVVTTRDLPRAGVYHLTTALAPQETGAPGIGEPDKGVPLAVVPDLRESDDLTTLTDEQLDERLGFAPIHVTAGGEETAGGVGSRLHREWTLWVLMLVLLLAAGEMVLAWWCGRAL
jgi:hypothetical protein